MKENAADKTPKVGLYEAKSPCGNCPYRTDAPLRLWDISEFQRLMEMERDFFGRVYNCHKGNGSVCVGWLMDQDKRNLPSIALRMSLTKHNVNGEYLDSLHSPAPLFDSVEEMVLANFPEVFE